MTEPKVAGGSNSEPTGLTSPRATFEKMKDLLKAKDDTSRFVGLALLKSVLDNEQQLVNNTERLQILWESISSKFLDRLLRAQLGGNVDKSQAKDMVDLAVAVLHTFSILLSENIRREPQLTRRTGPLVKALVQSSPETTQLILQTLLTIVSQAEGSLELLKVEDLSPLTEIAPQYPLVLDIFNYTWANGSTINTEVQAVHESINRVIPNLLVVFKGTDAVTFLTFIASFIPKLSSEALPRNPKWLKSITILLRALVNRKPTLIGRTAYTQAAAALLQAYPAACPSMLFNNESLQTSDKTENNNKPFSYLFINLLLIDLRSSFPSLLAKLNNSDYSAISQRLAAAFDVISSFIGYLVRSLDEDSNTFNLTPDLMLKLRKDIAETMSLAIEYLRDRWDASIAGASGLHPSARSGTAATSEGTRLTLTWDSMKDNVTADPLILASIRALAIWIREDENENLRKESAGMMDMFIELYKLSNKDEPGFRYPVLLALEGIMTTEDGVEAFLNQDGWQAVSEDLASIVSKSTDISSTNNHSIIISEAARGLQIVRVLLAVIDEEFTSYIKQEWLTTVSTTSSMQLPSSTSPSVVIELHIAMLQLSTALLSKAGDGMQKRFANDQKSLARIVQQLEVIVGEMEDKGEAAEFKELLSDVVLDLENLGGR
ncbi:35366ff8-8604-47d7-a34b-0c372026f106 [Sclerotinia trifoliorum]|uniref:35366ff8-8604-47d7-a34b-0c372026f106 n=1 Tax=Sclerotinia trifoliorum TaxID=28548 RepID=A0A8H2VU00_9HELO|nr:35366ff8-8604-47d7-a34b-0c372026f106 [Sclerotinia trifoliorum]